jgi:hypothetical protein
MAAQMKKEPDMQINAPITRHVSLVQITKTDIKGLKCTFFVLLYQ